MGLPINGEMLMNCKKFRSITCNIPEWPKQIFLSIHPQNMIYFLNGLPGWQASVKVQQID